MNWSILSLHSCNTNARAIIIFYLRVNKYYEKISYVKMWKKKKLGVSPPPKKSVCQFNTNFYMCYRMIRDGAVCLITQNRVSVKRLLYWPGKFGVLDTDFTKVPVTVQVIQVTRRGLVPAVLYNLPGTCVFILDSRSKHFAHVWREINLLKNHIWS